MIFELEEVSSRPPPRRRRGFGRTSTHGNQDLTCCCRHETERRSQGLRHNGLCHAGSRHPRRVNSDGWGSRYRFTAPRFSTTIRCCCFQVIRAAYGRFMRRSRIPKHSCRHMYSRCEVRSCGAGQPSEARQPKAARARTLGVNMLSENAFKEMPTLADKSSDFGFTSGIQVYFWTQRDIFNQHSTR